MKRALLTLSLGAVLVWSFLQFSPAQVVPQPGPPQAIACAYNTSPPTLTSGQAGWVQCDSTGKIITSGGGGGGGAVTIADGADVAEGALADTASSVGGTGSTSAKLRRITTQLDAIQTAVTGAVPAGTATIGTVGQLPYPVGATPYTATATGTTGATTATLAGASSVTTYLCGFSIRANATAAATGNATVTGVITATLNFTQWTAPNASGLGITEMIFSPHCIPASGTNQSVAVVSAAPGTGGVVSVTAWGYKL